MLRFTAPRLDSLVPGLALLFSVGLAPAALATPAERPLEDELFGRTASTDTDSFPRDQLLEWSRTGAHREGYATPAERPLEDELFGRFLVWPAVRTHAGIHGTPTERPLEDELFGRAQVMDQPALDQILAPEAQETATGAGVVVAVIDSGFDLSHEFWIGRTYTGYDAIDDDANPHDVGNGIDDDADGVVDNGTCHGNAAASLIEAVAPGASFLPIRALDDEGNGSDAALLAAISWAIDHDADVINMSFVATSLSTAVKDAIDAAVEDGIVIVASAGNDPLGPFGAPHLLVNSITVGSVDALGSPSTFSGSGPDVDVYAPGEDVIVALGGADTYGTWSGTSFSTPLTAGGAALLKEEHPTWGLAQVRTRLATTATPLPLEMPLVDGRIDLAAAMVD